MSHRGNQFPRIASPAVTICKFGNGWGFLFNQPCQKEAIGTKKYVEVTVDKRSKRINFRFVSKKDDSGNISTVSISGHSSYRSRHAVAGVPAGFLESLKVSISEKRQYVLHQENRFDDSWHINF